MMKLRFGPYEREIDIVFAYRSMQRLENEAGMKTTTPTAYFLKCVQKWISDHCQLQVAESTAWSFWWSVCEVTHYMRIKSEPEADLAFWYGFDPHQLNEFRKLALLANLPRVKAQQTLQSGQYDGTDYQTVYELTLWATGDKALAQRAASDAAERKVEHQVYKGTG